VNATGKKSALHFDGSKVITYYRNFVLLSEEFVNRFVVVGLENGEVTT
jgi:hypothetical protein